MTLGSFGHEVACAVEDAVILDRAVLAGNVLEGVDNVDKEQAGGEVFAAVGRGVEAKEVEPVVLTGRKVLA